MAEFLEIAGERVIDLDARETAERYLGIQATGAAAFAQRFADELGLSAELLDINKLPVLTSQRTYVLNSGLSGGVFSDRELRVGLDIGHMVCDPEPTPDHGARINGSSIDVTLGYNFYTAGKHKQSRLFNPFDQQSTFRQFATDEDGDGFLQAKPFKDVRDKLEDEGLLDTEILREYFQTDSLETIPEDHPIILLRPNERILAHTHEFIDIRPPGTTSMQARSTTGRIGVSACYCAGWGDPGYIDRWTMEIHNLNESDYVPLPAGWRIAQIVMSQTGPVGTEYSQASGNYQAQSSDDLIRVKQAWRPHHMIPRAHKNEIKLPRPVEGLAEGVK